MNYRDYIDEISRDELNPPTSTDEVAGYGDLLDTATGNLFNTFLPPLPPPTPRGGSPGGVLVDGGATGGLIRTASTARRLN